MSKYISSIFWAAVLLLASVPVQVQAAESLYQAELIYEQQGQEVSCGDMVSVQVKLSGLSEGLNQYSAYDLKLSYDSSHLEFVSGATALDDGIITLDQQEDDVEVQVHVKGYGEDKECTDPVVTLRFKVVKPGDTKIQLLNSRADFSANAAKWTAPRVKLEEGKKSVTIPVEGFEVEVEKNKNSDYVRIDKYVAYEGEDFSFGLEDYPYMDYEMTVTVDGDDITRVVDVAENGSCTIPGNEINGKIVITIDKCEPKTFVVKLDGSDVAGEKTAQFKKDYTFTLKREKGYLYTVSVTIGKEEYTEYNVEGDVYTVPGKDITGNITVTVKKEEDDSNKAKVTFAGAGAKDGSGQKKTEKGVEYPFQIKRKKGYTYSVTVYVEGKRTSYDYDYELDTYYILSDNVTGNIIIVIGKVPTVEVVEYITLDKQSIFLIVYNGVVNEGQVPRYDGRSMYWSERYRAYAWLVTSDGSDKKVKKAAEEKLVVGPGEPAGSIDYSGNVNMSQQIDQADAKLVWEMYQGKHSLDFTEMQKLLSADVSSDRKVTVRDVAAIVNRIS